MRNINATFGKISAIAGSAVGAFMASATAVLAVDTGLDQTAESAQLKAEGATATPNVAAMAGQIIGSLLALIGVVFFILMIYAGVLWMTSQGNEDQVSKAKSIIVGAVIGLIIISMAYGITSFIINNVVK